MIKLSAVIITFNEEKNIERCINSLLPVADEVVVVDSFSTDRTVELAQALGAKVVAHKFDGHIQQKNWAITQARSPYVLSLDADEALSEQLQKSILEAKSSWNADGYRMKRLTNYCGQWIKHCGWYPDIKLRLFDSRKGAWGGRNPHDKYTLADYTKTPLLDGNLLHYSFYTIEQHVRTFDNFSSIGARVLYEEGKKAPVLKIIFGPLVRFLRDYILKQGFRDGFYGYVICKNNAHMVFLKYAKLFAMWKNSKSGS